uniref:Uncharacterized protein n=1 Tax=Oryza brachyantha TaxID=4533 RepID=J3KUT9_ORYBR
MEAWDKTPGVTTPSSHQAQSLNIRERVQRKFLKIDFVPTGDQVSDGFTKDLTVSNGGDESGGKEILLPIPLLVEPLPLSLLTGVETITHYVIVGERRMR